MNSIILQAGTKLLVGVLLIFSVYMLLRGHNLPGGGFIGGLVGATGFILHAIASGPAEARAALRVPPQSVAICGLGTALAAGLMPVLTGETFFTGQWLYIGDLALSSVLLFDIGVYLVVFGSVLTLVLTLEEAV